MLSHTDSLLMLLPLRIRYNHRLYIHLPHSQLRDVGVAIHTITYSKIKINA